MKKFLHELAHRLGVAKGAIVSFEDAGHKFVAWRCDTCEEFSYTTHAVVACGCDRDKLSIN